MVQERMQKRPKVEYEETIEGFLFPQKSTCPVYFGSGENKQKILDVLCKEMHTKSVLVV